MNFEIKLKTLTPIWTGDINRESPQIRETGIIGSLRWWYEAMIRALGGYACDPATGGCSKEGEKKICPACELFGCTGWGKKFRLQAEGKASENIHLRIQTRKLKRRNGKPLERQIKGLLYTDASPLTLRLIPLGSPKRHMEDWECVLLEAVIRLIENCGGLGAKLAQGNGVIKVLESNFLKREKSFKELLQDAREQLKEKSKALPHPDPSWPNLSDFRFGNFKILFNQPVKTLILQQAFFGENCTGWEDYGNNYRFLPIAPHIRDIIRSAINSQNRGRRHEVFGFIGRREETRGSRVFVSHGYYNSTSSNEVNFRIYMYKVNEDEIDKIGEKLSRDIERYLFKDEEVSGRVQTLYLCTQPLIQNGNPTNVQMSQYMKKWEDCLGI